MPRQLRAAIHVSPVWQALHVDGLLDEASARRMRRVAEVQLRGLRQEIPTQGLSVTPREQRSQQIGKFSPLRVKFVTENNQAYICLEECDCCEPERCEPPTMSYN